MSRNVRGLGTKAVVLCALVAWLAALAGMSASPAVAPAATPDAGQNSAASTKPRKPVDWVALNPGFKGATFVNSDKDCMGCHEDSAKAYHKTKHAYLFSQSAPAGSTGCESCHGPQSRHLENPDDPARELKIDPKSPLHSGICLQCHEGGPRMSWKSGAHHTSEVGCASCHDVMEKKSERALLQKASVVETCYVCHTEVRGEMSKVSHHPLREGRMDCASCHNSHGATNALLIKPTVTDTCATCHTEKRGPFVWEHAPVRESCATCHTPHGSNERKLLARKDPFLCMSCHSYGGHINLPRYNRVGSSYGSGCMNCHITTHGSNHPSGAKFTR